MSNDSYVGSSVTFSLPKKPLSFNFWNMVYNRTGGVNDASTRPDEPQTDFHVFSMVPLRIESPNGKERASQKHRTWSIRKTRSSWSCSVFTCNFHRTNSAHNVAVMGEHGASCYGYNRFTIGNWFCFSNHRFDPVRLGPNVNVGDGDPFSFCFLDRPLAPCRETFCGLSEHSNRWLTTFILPFEQAFGRTIRRSVIHCNYFERPVCLCFKRLEATIHPILAIPHTYGH